MYALGEFRDVFEHFFKFKIRILNFAKLHVLLSVVRFVKRCDLEMITCHGWTSKWNQTFAKNTAGPAKCHLWRTDPATSHVTCQNSTMIR